MIDIRPAHNYDLDQIWAIARPILRAGDTYAFDTEMDKAGFRDNWLAPPRRAYAAWREDTIVGSYFLKPNLGGHGDHVCNAGYMVSEAARGQGIARRLCQHSQDEARRLGFLAMQFNCVVSTNEIAAALWIRLGFETIGRLPRAFRHPTEGFVDTLVMYKWLDETSGR